MSISTSQLIGLTGNFKDVPYIPANITLEQAQTLLIPSGFDDLISVESDELSQSLKLEIETEGDNENVIVFISKTFGPDYYPCILRYYKRGFITKFIGFMIFSFGNTTYLVFM